MRICAGAVSGGGARPASAGEGMGVGVGTKGGWGWAAFLTHAGRRVTGGCKLERRGVAGRGVAEECGLKTRAAAILLGSTGRFRSDGGGTQRGEGCGGADSARSGATTKARTALMRGGACAGVRQATKHRAWRRCGGIYICIGLGSGAQTRRRARAMRQWRRSSWSASSGTGCPAAHARTVGRTVAEGGG